MKTLLIAVFFLLPQIAQAQFEQKSLRNITNDVFSNVQGYVDQYGKSDGMNYVMGASSKYLDANITRTMIDLALTGHPVISGWKREEDRFLKSILVEDKYITTVAYVPALNLVIIIYVEK